MSPQVAGAGKSSNPTRSTVTIMSDVSTSGNAEFDAFHDLLGKLVKVPKSELDEAREQERSTKP